MSGRSEGAGAPVVLHVDTRYYDIATDDWDPTPEPRQIVLGTSNMIEVEGINLSVGGCAFGGP